MRSRLSLGSETHPSLLRSTSAGAVARTYVQVQMMSRTTLSSEWKLNNADYVCGMSVKGMQSKSAVVRQKETK